MNNKRVSEILKNKKLHDVYYDDRPVWIQEIDNNIAKVGFIDKWTLILYIKTSNIF